MLVVDDDRIHRNMAVKALSKQDYEVQTAEDGLKALVMCLKEPPDVILTDVQMPRMDGWNFLRTIRARASLSSTLVLFQTSLNSETDRLLGYKLGVDDYIAKPYSADDLIERIEKLLANNASRSKSLVTKALRGDLEQVSLPTVLSLLEMEKKTGVVVIVGSKVCRIFMSEGRPLGIEMDGEPEDTDQMELATKLFAWQNGQFEFSRQDVPRIDRINMSMQSLIMEAARIADENGL